MNDAVLVALAGALGGVLTLVATRWKTKGEWTDKELRDVRQDLRARIKELEDREEAREQEMRILLTKNWELQKTVADLSARIVVLERKVKDLGGEV